MKEDRERWERRYAASSGELSPPDPFVVAAVHRQPLQPAARVLDVASGRGRHALWFVAQGARVEAWDASETALADLARRAHEMDRTVTTRCVDLDSPTWPSSDPFDLVVVVNFLDREVLKRIPDRLRPGGHLVFTTFTVDHPGEHPRAPFRLKRGELGHGLPDLETVWSQEQGGRAGILARRA